ncbi:MAG: GNAT family N-acetyltransferase [Sulfolobales archaeon]|nr:GNAT family N-acetyltransferase [Sulfolobales archaeon]MCX8199294.1 GNAT family N-acetyltransferase [Sulfolobales archaeon]MDW8170392.1 GNAT family N-acetyltransferase [Desulfurococcaceae archaeon]
MMSGDIVLRNARSRDVNRIFEIHLNSLEELDEEDYEWFKALINTRSKRKKVIVAEVEGKVVGFIITYKHRHLTYIDSLAVDSEYRGLGIGSLLLDYLEETLVREGVEEVFLSVKDRNLAALNFYLKRGYSFKGLVALLRANLRNLDKPIVDGYRVERRSINNVMKIIKLRPTTWWSTLTEPADKMIYRGYNGGEEAILVYRGRKLRGLAEYSPEDEMIVDYIAISYYKPLEAFKALLSGLISVSLEKGLEYITIPVDASKERIIETLVKTGFTVKAIEYMLSKELQRN